MISISDVITNSSSEVFVYYNKYSLERIKELVDAILGTFHIDKTFDDLFTIEFYLSEWATEGMSVKDAFDKEVDEYGYPLIGGYKILPKERGQYEYLCQKLSNLDDIFPYDEVYC